MKKILFAFTVVTLLMIGVVTSSQAGLARAASMTATAAPSATHSAAATCQQPDRTRDPNTLSASERMAQGYPIAMKGLDTSAIDRTYRQKGLHICTATSTNIKNLGADYGSTSTNWAGNVAYQRNSSNGLYPGVYGTWKVSCLPHGTNDDYSTWVGLGGNGNNQLLQTGIHGYNRGSGPQYVAWIENLGDSSNPNEQDVFGVKCGDSIYAEADAPNYMYIHDETSNLAYSVNFGPAANETTAECIVERPSVGGGLAYGLSAFGVETFNTCEVNSTGWGYFSGMGNAYHFYLTMVNGSGKTLASPGPITNNTLGTYSVTWHAYN